MRKGKKATKYMLVTGGAGYIGSFMAKKLASLGFVPVTLDNLSNGRKESVFYGEFIKGDIGNSGLVKEVISHYQIKDVFHFAAFSSIEESFAMPDQYMENNVQKSRQLFETCQQQGVERIIYSSSCTVYGIPDNLPIKEDSPLQPINPYGESKKLAEAALMSMGGGATQLKYVILRYFNVVGATLNGTLGEYSNKNQRLFKIVAEKVTGKRDKIYINGTDYPTPDGTAIRDYIHVEDLVDVHWLALGYLVNGGNSEIFNVGYGRGWSVKEIIDTFKEVMGQDIPVENRGRRPGDAPELVGDIGKLTGFFNWKPLYNNMPTVVKSVLEWEKRIGVQPGTN